MNFTIHHSASPAYAFYVLCGDCNVEVDCDVVDGTDIFTMLTEVMGACGNHVKVCSHEKGQPDA